MVRSDSFARDAYDQFGGWMLDAPADVANYMVTIKQQHKLMVGTSLALEVQAFQDFVESDPTLRLSLSQAIEESLMIAEQEAPSDSSPAFTDIPEFMSLLNMIVTCEPPAFTGADDHLIGFPLNAVVNWMMAAPHGYSFFRDSRVNQHLKAVLGVYMTFLDSSASTKYLTTDSRGWFSSNAQEVINFSEFVHDPMKPHWGWTSWNDFFTREFVPGIRPVEQPENSKVITSGCEATPYQISHDVNLKDKFWLKNQNYSLVDIFTAERSDLATVFDGGSIYQAFLSAFEYHRWASPVKGTVTDIYHVDGTYYSQAEFAGVDPAGPNDSQVYLTAVAARMVFVIQADDPALGVVSVVQVGMAECSSTVSTVSVGQRLEKGDEIGMFKFGGSTFCTIFQKGVIRNFTVDVNDEGGSAVKLNTQIAWAN